MIQDCALTRRTVALCLLGYFNAISPHTQGVNNNHLQKSQSNSPTGQRDFLGLNIDLYCRIGKFLKQNTHISTIYSLARHFTNCFIGDHLNRRSGADLTNGNDNASRRLRCISNIQKSA